MFSRMPNSAILMCNVTGSCFQLKIEDGGRKTGNTFISAYGLARNEIPKAIFNDANDAKTFLKHFSDCLFYFCSTCTDSIS